VLRRYPLVPFPCVEGHIRGVKSVFIGLSVTILRPENGPESQLGSRMRRVPGGKGGLFIPNGVERPAGYVRRGRVVLQKSPKRRRSMRDHYARNAPARRRKARAYYRASREQILAQQRRRRQEQRRRPHPLWRRVTDEREWADIRDFYQQRNRYEPYLLSMRLVVGISPYAIARRSQRNGGWALRVRT
jgi:hypothetical protein